MDGIKSRKCKALVSKIPSDGFKFYDWDKNGSDSRICQRVASHGRTKDDFNIEDLPSESAERGQCFYYCETCGWLIDYYYNNRYFD